MGLSAFLKKISAPGAIGSQAYTGFGFQQKAGIGFGVGMTADGYTSGVNSGPASTLGIAASSSQRGSIAATTNSPGFKGTGSLIGYNANNKFLAKTDTASLTEAADLTSFDADGETLNWSAVDTLVSNYFLLGLGGTDITNVAEVTFGLTAGTGNQAVTGVGFTPDLIILICNGYTIANTAAGGMFGWGYMTPTFQGAVGFQDLGYDGARTQTASQSRTDRCICIPTPSTGTSAQYLELSYVSFDADGFTINKNTNTPGTSRVYALCLKGSFQVAQFIQDFPAATGTDQTITPSFTPVVLLHSSFGGAVGTTPFMRRGINFSFGAHTSTSNGYGFSHYSEDGNTTGINAIGGQKSANMIWNDAQATITAFSGSAITFHPTTASGVSMRYHGLYLGAAGGGGGVLGGGTSSSTAAFPTVAADDSGVGSLAWSATNNALTADASYAIVSPNNGQISHYLKLTGYDFSAIPSGSAILGVVATVMRKAQTQNASVFVSDSTLKLVKAGTVSGNNKAVTGSPGYPTTAATATYGSSSDLWGLSLSTSDVQDATFGVALSVTATTTGSTDRADIDYISLTVSWRSPWTLSGSGLGSTVGSTTSAVRPKLIAGLHPSSQLGASTTVLRSMTFRRALIDTAGLQTAALRSLTFRRTLADNAGLSTALLRAATVRRVVQDAMGASDAYRFALVFQRAVASILALSDAIAASKASLRVRSDILGLSTPLPKRACINYRRLAAETIGLSTAAKKSVSSLRSATDNLGVSTPVARLAFSRTLAAASVIAFSDAAALKRIMGFHAADTVGFTQAFFRAVDINRRLDGIGYGNTLGLLTTFHRDVATIRSILGTGNIIGFSTDTDQYIGGSLTASATIGMTTQTTHTMSYGLPPIVNVIGLASVGRVLAIFNRVRTDSLGMNTPAPHREMTWRRRPSDAMGIAGNYKRSSSVIPRLVASLLGVSTQAKRSVTAFRKIQGDKIGVSDSVFKRAIVLRRLIDQVALATSAKQNATFRRRNADTMALATQALKAAINRRRVIDHMGLGTSLRRTAINLRKLADVLALTTQPKTKTQAMRVIVEALGFSDHLITEMIWRRIATATIGAQTAAQRKVAVRRVVRDTIGASTNLRRAATIMRRLISQMGVKDRDYLTKVLGDVLPGDAEFTGAGPGGAVFGDATGSAGDAEVSNVAPDDVTADPEQSSDA